MPPPWIPLSKRLALERMVRGKDMKYPHADWWPGPPQKQNGGVNTVRGVVCHSMVGPYAAALGELNKPSRRASWHFSVLKDGSVKQHYDTTVQAWHAGSNYNNSTVGIEHEGGLNPANEPLTPAQLKASVDLVQWLSRNHGFPLIRKVGLWEHNEVSGEPTACPSGRIPWEFYVQEEVEDMKPIRVWCAERGMTYLVAGTSAVPIRLPADDKEFEKLYGPHVAVLSGAQLDAMVAK